MTDKPSITKDEFLAATSGEEDLGQLSMHCNALYISEKSINLYLSPVQALRMAANLTRKAEMLIRHNVDDPVIQVWGGKISNGGSLSFGLENAVKKNTREP